MCLSSIWHWMITIVPSIEEFSPPFYPRLVLCADIFQQLSTGLPHPAIDIP